MFPKIPKYLVDKFHSLIIEKYGGDDGEINPGAIESALSAPFASFGGTELFDTDLKKCCRLLYGLIYNHGYADGNKRIGAFMFLYLLDVCGIGSEKITNEFLTDISLSIASGRFGIEEVIYLVEGQLS